MAKLEDNISWLQTRIHDTRALLMEITTTPRTLSQEITHGEYIKRLNVLELDRNTDPLDTRAVHGNDIDAVEFKNLRTFILNIEHERPQTTTTYAHKEHTTPCPPHPILNQTPRPV